jgi:hypothetical protein
VIIFAIFAAASAWIVTRKAPQHRPIAWALTVCAGLDAVRLLGFPARADMALCLYIPTVSALGYLRILTGMWLPIAALCTYISGALAALCWWHAALPVAYSFCVILSLFAAFLWGQVSTVTQRAVLMLLAGDALAVASLCGREWISHQAGVVLGLVTLYQLMWWWRWNREQAK